MYTMQPANKSSILFMIVPWFKHWKVRFLRELPYLNIVPFLINHRWRMLRLDKEEGSMKTLGRTAYGVKSLKNHWQLYVILVLPLLYLIIFRYIPIFGAQIAFKDYMVKEGILGSPWVGLKYFTMFFKSPHFTRLIKNTLTLSVYSLVAGFPLPIILALLLNEVRNRRFKKTVQMVTYAPYFISMVVMVSMLMQFLAPRTGIINQLITLITGKELQLMAKAEYFKTLYVWSGIWQMTGYSSIIYIAALSSIDLSLYEAATVDGATKLQKMRHIDLPGIMPTAIILLIMNVGRLMNVGFEKVYLMQNSLNLSSSEIIATYVYKIGLVGAQFSFSTAVGLFNSVINLILLVAVNQIAKKIGGTSLW